MYPFRYLTALFILSSTAFAFPHQRSRPVGNSKRSPIDAAQGGYVSNGILYLRTTVVVTTHPSASQAAIASAVAPSPSTVLLAIPAPSPTIDSSKGYVSDGILYLTKTVVVTSRPSTSKAAAVSVASPSPSIPSPSVASSVPVPGTFSTVISQLSTSSAVAPSSRPAASPAIPVATSPLPASPSKLDASLIIAIMPSSTSCANAPYPAECKTAEQAAPFISAAFEKYEINSKAAQAATLALQAVESGEFKYDHSHFPAPGTPGKGTRNMQSPQFNMEYAGAVLDGSQVKAAASPDAVLALVNSDANSFASASWFLATKCPAVLQQFSSDTDAAWTAYLGSGCIGTSNSDERTRYWIAAKKAFGIS